MSYHIPIKKVTIGGKTLFPDSEIVIKERGICVILGSNGSGKTTLVNQILYSNPESVLLIAQENDLIFADRSVEDNIILFDGDTDRLHMLLRTVDMEYLLTRDTSHLSGGEKRIVSLLRLFFVDRDIVILDEPTNDLDYRCVETVKRIIIDLSHEKSVLIVSHDERIVKLADTKYTISDGTIRPDCSQDESACSVPGKGDSPNIKKSVRRDRIGVVLFLLVILSLLFSELAFFLFKPEQIEYVTDNQTNLATRRYGGVNAMIAEGYLPIKTYLGFHGSIDPDYLSLYSETLTEALMSGGSSDMFVEDDYGEDVFLSVFWDPENDEKTYPLRDYQELYFMINGQNLSISDYITISDGISEIADVYSDGVKSQIDKQLFKSMVDAYFSVYPKLQPVMYVVLEENSDRLETANENWFVKNNVTVDICNQINALGNLKNYLITTLLCLVGGVGVYFLYFLINLKLLRKQIILFRNLGVPVASLKAELFKSKCASKENAIILLPFVISNAVCLFIFSEKIVFAMTMILSLTVYISLTLLTRKILAKNVRSVYSFGGLYENRD